MIQITEYEKKIESLKLNNEDLKEDLNKLKIINGNSDQEVIRERDDEQDKIVADIEQRASSCTLLMNKLTAWVDKNITKLTRAGLLEEGE